MKNVIHMIPMTNKSIGNSFVITTDDGRVIVVDGGWRSDTDNLISRLRDITGERTPHVHGWLLSHAHDDHICAFMGLIERRMGDVIIDKVYYCFPSTAYCMRCEPHDGHTVQEFYSLLPKFAGIAQIVNQGDSFAAHCLQQFPSSSFLFPRSPISPPQRSHTFLSNKPPNSPITVISFLHGPTFSTVNILSYRDIP